MAGRAARSVARVNPHLLASLQQRTLLHAGENAQAALPAGTCLHFEEVQAPAAGATGAAGHSPVRTAVFLHGLLGNGKNLRSAATDLCRQAAAESGEGWRAVLLDLRNHGKSAALGLHPPHTLAAAARDVIQLFKQVLNGAPDVLVGHSLGGKTALEVVRQLALAGAPPVGQPRQVWVLDARPTAVHTIDQPTQEVLDVLQAVEGVPLPLASRKALYAGLEEKGMSVGLQQWLGSSLREEEPGQLVWTFNVHGAQKMFDDYLRLDYSSLLKAPPAGVNLHILRAMRSGRWDHDTLATVRQAVAATAQPAAVRGRTWYHELADAGHWVHADNPKGLVKIMLPSLLETAGAAPAGAAAEAAATAGAAQ